jgi:hypothetical protein
MIASYLQVNKARTAVGWSFFNSKVSHFSTRLKPSQPNTMHLAKARDNATLPIDVILLVAKLLDGVTLSRLASSCKSLRVILLGYNQFWSACLQRLVGGLRRAAVETRSTLGSFESVSEQYRRFHLFYLRPECCGVCLKPDLRLVQISKWTLRVCQFCLLSQSLLVTTFEAVEFYDLCQSELLFLPAWTGYFRDEGQDSFGFFTV